MTGIDFWKYVDMLSLLPHNLIVEFGDELQDAIFKNAIKKNGIDELIEFQKYLVKKCLHCIVPKLLKYSF